MKEITPNDVILAASREFNVSVEDLKGDSRKEPLSFYRQLTMSLVYMKCRISLSETGKHFGNRNHSSAFYAISRAECLLATDINLRKNHENIHNSLLSGDS